MILRRPATVRRIATIRRMATVRRIATVRAAMLMAIAAATALAQITPPSGASTARKPAAPAGLPNYHELKYPELHPIAAPAIQSFTLDNGIRLLLLENHELPLINGTILVRTGSAFDPPEKIGLAAMVGQTLLEGGTTGKAGEDLIRRFQDMGAELEGTTRENVLSISFSGLKENADAVLDALKDGITAPEFPQDRIDLVKTRFRNAIAHRNDDPGAVLRREFATTVYGKNSPYGARMEYVNLDRINRGDLVSFYQRYFFPKNVTISLDGDFDSAKMKSRIEAVFDDWKNEQPAVPDFPKADNAGAPGKYLAVRKDVTHSFFEIGQEAGDYLDKDYPALQIMADILGGLHGRIDQRMHGSIDGLSVAWAPGFGHPGLFKVTGTVANPFSTPQVLQTVYEELNRIRAEQVSEQELKTAKDAALNSLVFAFDSPWSILPRLTEYQYFNFPADYTQQYQKALEGVTRADVLRVAKERLDPARMTTVVVGNPTAFERPLDSLDGTAVGLIDLTIPASKPEATLGDVASQRRGKQILARAQQAVGGADKLAAVTDYVQEIAYQFDVSAGGAQVTMTERWIGPSHIRQDNSSAATKVSVYCDGKTGWVANTRASGPLNGVQLKQVQGDLFHVIFPVLLSDRTPTRKVNALDGETVEISDGAGQIVKVVFDSSTGLPKNMLYDATTENGPVPVIETFSDFREVSGLKLPSKVAITLAGKKFQDLTIKSIQINTGLKLQDLEKRP
jgi:zinc protease